MTYQRIANTLRTLTRQREALLSQPGEYLMNSWVDSALVKQKQYYRLREWKNGKRVTVRMLGDGEVGRVREACRRGQELKRIEAKIAQAQGEYDRIAELASAIGVTLKNPLGDRDATPEWYTPPQYIEMARTVLGSIDLDPASCELAQSWIQAETFYTKQQDGLKKPWFGRIWSNPPYGSGEVRLLAREFVERAITEYEQRRIESAIFLVNRSGAAWYRDARRRVSVVCEVHRRIAFLDENGVVQKSPRYNNDFLYLGTNIKQFSEVFSRVGDVQSF